MSSRQFKWALLVLAIVGLVGAAVLLAGCPKPEQTEVTTSPRQGVAVPAQPIQAPQPQLTYRERKARGLLTPEELQSERQAKQQEQSPPAKETASIAAETSIAIPPIREECPRSTKLIEKVLAKGGTLQVTEADASAMWAEWGKPPGKAKASDGDVFMWDLYKDGDGNFSRAIPGDESWCFAILTVPDSPEAPLVLTADKRDNPAVIKQ